MTYCVENLKFDSCLVCTSTPDFLEFIHSLINDGTDFYVDWVHDAEQCAICVVYF